MATIPPTTSIPKGTTFSAIKPKVSFFARLSSIWTIITFIFVASILVMAVIVSIQDKTIKSGIEYLGNRTMYVTENLNDASLQVIENKGIYVKSDYFFKDIWNFIKSIWTFLVALFFIWYWLKVLGWFFKKVVIQDDSKTTASFMLALIFFVLIQILFIVLFTDKPVMTPVNAFINFAKSLPYVFAPAVEIIDNIK
jgi:hypothetical protein